MLVDLNHQSGSVYGGAVAPRPLGDRIDTLINAGLTAERAGMPARDYLGASRIGEPCARRLCYESMRIPVDPGADFSGRMLRIFETGHRFEDMTIRWLRLAGFDLRTHNRKGEQFGFSVAGDRFRGHIDGVMMSGPDVAGIEYPILFEHKALKSSSWQDLVKRGLKASKPIYWAQAQIYMGYLAIERTLFVALDKDTQALRFDIIAFDSAAAQALSDKAVAVIRAADSGELLPRISDRPDFYICSFCPYRIRCHDVGGDG